MKIRREYVPTADNFTIIPNAWARDPNLSRRAVGMLVELLSHREGWEVTVESLWRGGTEGRAASCAARPARGTCSDRPSTSSPTRPRGPVTGYRGTAYRRTFPRRTFHRQTISR